MNFSARRALHLLHAVIEGTACEGWLAVTESKDDDIFVAFAFEVGGAWGTEAEDFLHEAVKVAEHCRNGVGDLSHWSAMNWGGHWRQRIGVEIARGLARCVERAATEGLYLDRDST